MTKIVVNVKILRSISFSIGRLPIGRGMRARRCYKTPITQKVTIQKHNAIIISDEENTSEYSHSPSSQHSTLESNPDMPDALQKMKIAANNTNMTGNHQYTISKLSTTTTTTTSDSESSEFSETESCDYEEDVSYDVTTIAASSTNVPHRPQRQSSTSVAPATATATTTAPSPSPALSSASFSKKKSLNNTNIRDSNNASFKQKQKQQQQILMNTTNNHHNKSDVISIPTYNKDGAINMV